MADDIIPCRPVGVIDCITTTRNDGQDMVDAKTAQKRGKRGYGTEAS
jgi:hypothetical protein